MEACLKADTHVHFHEQFTQEEFLDAALANLSIGKDDSGFIHGVLCLTETSKASWFAELELSIGESLSPDSDWRIEKTNETNSILAMDGSGSVLAIVAGRQIVTHEGLEVLALGLNATYSDGRPLTTVMRDVAAAGAIPVIPWGFGKWLGRRGKLVRQIIVDPPCFFLLGDNGGRPWFFREPRLLVVGRRHGIATVCGTDPFPFAWDRRRVGTFGSQWNGGVSSEWPFHELKKLIESGRGMQRYGPLEGAASFFRNQIAIQARKWLARFFAQAGAL